MIYRLWGAAGFFLVLHTMHYCISLKAVEPKHSSVMRLGKQRQLWQISKTPNCSSPISFASQSLKPLYNAVMYSWWQLLSDQNPHFNSSTVFKNLPKGQSPSNVPFALLKPTNMYLYLPCRFSYQIKLQRLGKASTATSSPTGNCQSIIHLHMCTAIAVPKVSPLLSPAMYLLYFSV